MKKSYGRKGKRWFALFLCLCLIGTTTPVTARAENEKTGDILYVSGFLELPEEVREQTVSVGTDLKDLTLPAELTVSLAEDKNITETESGTEPEDGTESGTETDTESGTEPEDKTETETEHTVPAETDESGEADAPKKSDAADEDTDVKETDAAEQTANSDNNNDDADSDNDETGQKTYIVTMPEYNAENVIIVETLEADTAQETPATITGIAWQSEPEYDKNAEGKYIFTAVLPEGYAPAKGVSLPQITVTVEEESTDDAVQALIDRISALPDSEEYLAGEPDTGEEDAYEEWMEGLYGYAEKALAILEEYEALTKEQQEKIPEEMSAKLKAWAELAEQIVGNAMMMANDLTWNGTVSGSQLAVAGGSEANPLVVTVSGDVSVSGCINVNSGYVKFTGNGSLKWNAAGQNALVVAEGANVAFENVTLDGGTETFSRSALLLKGTVIFGNGTTVQNFKSTGASGTVEGAKGVIAVYGKGSLTILDGASIQQNQCDKGIIVIYQNDMGGGKSTAKVSMSGGTISGNTVGNSNLGVIWNWCGNLEITGGTVTAEGNEYAVHTQGNYGYYDATTYISGGSFTGNTLGAVCAGKDASNNSKITIMGGSFQGKTAATVNYGTIDIQGGSYQGDIYALSTNNGANSALNVSGGEFYGGTKAYSGNVTTLTDKVIVGDSKEAAANWDKQTALNTYRYVAIGELADAPGDTPSAEKHEHNDVTFIEWTKTDSLPDTAGNYYLTEDVTLSGYSPWEPANGTRLCLNGHKITRSTHSTVITIEENKTFNMYDCKDSGMITQPENSSSTDYYRSGIDNNGTFHMYGGKICGNASTKGAGVYNRTKGTFYLCGGEISNNVAGNIGAGGVDNEGTFYMYGGRIIGNTAQYGGGVRNGNLLYIYGGEISGNKTTTSNGGGIWNADNGSKMTVGGSPVIKDNIKSSDSSANNVYFVAASIILDSSKPLEDRAYIGVTAKTLPTKSQPQKVTGHNKDDYSQYFHSDNPDYEIVNASDYVQLTVKTPPDTQPPTGKIEVATGNLTSASWTEFLAPDKVAFHLFFKARKWVTIYSADEGGSGVYGTHYYVSNEALTKEQVEALDADAWTADATVVLEPEPDRKCIVYAKITDGAGNVAYLSSDGLVFDTTPPIITGVTDGETYNAPQTVTVTDALSGVKSVTVNGAEVTLTDNQFTLGTQDNPQTIVVMDKAGNTTTVTVTVQAQTQSYAVTVSNGTGTGIYRAGDTVTITADAAPSGKQFDKWTVNSGSVTLANATSSTTTFTMPERVVEVEATYKDIAEEHTHNYGEWQHNDTQHWKACSCGDEIDRGDHDFGGWITDKAATETEAGTRHKECQICGHRKTETIPATGTDPGSGTVTPEVKPGDNAPATNISTPTEELKDMLLTEDEKQQVENGTNVRIVLEVQDAGTNVSDLDEKNIRQALNGFAVGQYLNIDLYKMVGDKRTDITETAQKIRIVINVPDSLKNTDNSKARTFAVIRVHGGGAERLDDLDNSADTITIETDRFSTYAIVYKDMSNGGNGGNNGGGNNNNSNNSNNSNQNNVDNNGTKPDSTKDNEPKTGDAAPLELYATLAMIAGFTYLLLYFADRRRGMTEETKKELVSRLVGWAKRGGRIRKCLALAAIFVLLVYYHSIGKKTCAEWKEIYG